MQSTAKKQTRKFKWNVKYSNNFKAINDKHRLKKKGKKQKIKWLTYPNTSIITLNINGFNQIKIKLIWGCKKEFKNYCLQETHQIWRNKELKVNEWKKIYIYDANRKHKKAAVVIWLSDKNRFQDVVGWIAFSKKIWWGPNPSWVWSYLEPGSLSM